MLMPMMLPVVSGLLAVEVSVADDDAELAAAAEVGEEPSAGTVTTCVTPPGCVCVTTDGAALVGASAGAVVSVGWVVAGGVVPGAAEVVPAVGKLMRGVVVSGVVGVVVVGGVVVGGVGVTGAGVVSAGGLGVITGAGVVCRASSPVASTRPRASRGTST